MNFRAIRDFFNDAEGPGTCRNNGILGVNRYLKPEKDDGKSGYRNASTLCDAVASKEVMGKIELLVAELEAIEWWDAVYWRSKRPEVYETLALAARQKRRSEVLDQLLENCFSSEP